MCHGCFSDRESSDGIISLRLCLQLPGIGESEVMEIVIYLKSLNYVEVVFFLVCDAVETSISSFSDIFRSNNFVS